MKPGMTERQATYVMLARLVLTENPQSWRVLTRERRYREVCEVCVLSVTTAEVWQVKVTPTAAGRT